MADARTARLVRVVEHTAATRSLFLAPTTPFPFAPGAFLSCLVPGPHGRLNRAYSIASDPERRDELELLVDLVPGGPGSTWLFGRVPGDPIAFTGPWGTCTCDRAPDVEAIFVALETGIAAIRPMVRRCVATASHPVRLLHAAHRPIYRDELAGLAGLHAAWTTPDRLETEVGRRWIDADADRTRRFWICGVGDRVHGLRDLLRGAGYARRAVRYERW